MIERSAWIDRDVNVAVRALFSLSHGAKDQGKVKARVLG